MKESAGQQPAVLIGEGICPWQRKTKKEGAKSLTKMGDNLLTKERYKDGGCWWFEDSDKRKSISWWWW